jgi:hypothetical protein
LSESWSIRPYRAGDEAALVELFERVFKKRITTSHWLWKFRGYETPFENVWLAVEGDRIVFQYAGIPVRVQTGRGLEWAVQSVDTMADPDYRRKGLFREVAGHSFGHWREAGAAFVYGLPNEQSAPGFKSLGFAAPFAMQWRRFPLRPWAILARRSGLPLPVKSLDALWLALISKKSRSTIALAEVSRADATIDGISERDPQRRISVVRNASWVNWRYLSVPGAGYRVLVATGKDGPLGYAAFRSSGSSGMVADVFALEDEAALALFRGAIERLREAGAESIVALAVPGSAFDRSAERLRFLSGARFDFIVLPLSETIPQAHLANPECWHLSGGDFDVV